MKLVDSLYENYKLNQLLFVVDVACPVTPVLQTIMWESRKELTYMQRLSLS